MSITATVRMWGNTRALRIPKPMAQQLGLESGSRVRLIASDAGLLVRPLRPRRTYRLSDLLTRCRGPNPHREAVTGRAGSEAF
jgi:antitoxin MazE